jgi:hypothetical protein
MLHAVLAHVNLEKLLHRSDEYRGACLNHRNAMTVSKVPTDIMTRLCKPFLRLGLNQLLDIVETALD